MLFNVYQVFINVLKWWDAEELLQVQLIWGRRGSEGMGGFIVLGFFIVAGRMIVAGRRKDVDKDNETRAISSSISAGMGWFQE